MIHYRNRRKILLVLGIAGFGISILTALEGQFPWVASFCGFFGDGCTETAKFTILEMPLWFWGAIYYMVLTGAILFVRPAVFWLVMAGLGVEIKLAWVMTSMKLVCIFCLFNAGIAALLVILCFETKRLWQSMAIGLLVLSLSDFLLSGSFPYTVDPDFERQSTTKVAQVGDEIITLVDLESPLASQIYKLERDIYQLKRNHLEDLIDDILLRKEAEGKKISVQQLLDSLLSNTIDVNDEEVENYYLQNQFRWVNWTASKAELKSLIRNYLRKQKTRNLIKEHIEPLREQYPVTVYLPDPPLPFTRVSVEGSPASGPDNAAVTIVEFSDYLCPVCRKAHQTSRKIKEIYAGKIKWVFKDFPLDIHAGAKKLAEAARCAGEQGKFWEYQDRLFASEGKPNLESLHLYAEQLGIDSQKFRTCLEDGQYIEKISEDIQQAKRSGIHATPTFIINGKLKPGSLALEDFKRLIDEELKKDRIVRIP
jgi:protein-disulfide isomerase